MRASLRGPAGQSGGGGGHNNNNAAANHVHAASPYHSPAPPAKHKDSMLDKFKLFNHKEKDARNKTTSKWLISGWLGLLPRHTPLVLNFVCLMHTPSIIRVSLSLSKTESKGVFQIVR